ncbi:hypothetical protein LIER_12725 [Lithospermum erythrorhizon]|uniref:Uncharacterized protein n=1 Tax=Lithospermum erythrorhizon TaxID=34254 RepID=A0AAV3PUQ8_LITER
MEESSKNPSSRPAIPSKVLEGTLREVQLARDSPEAHYTPTSPDLDDSKAPLDVQPLRSRIGPPLDKARASVSKPSKGKSSKEAPTLEEVKAKTIPVLITD